MFVAALLMCLLLALGSAHVYERCELARELASLGVDKEHLATWVCIAYHESRFDTAARNHGSGDHGLLQISELYWCGPGKACGVPCTAFRDEDISDDVECAQKIYEEHTRLQGDGFLAWVVYPLHCKNNPKKYLAECEGSVKNVTENIETTARSLKGRSRNIATSKTLQPNYLDTNRPKPSYLAINSIFESSYSKGIENTNEIENWLDFKIDNVDDLKLPVTNNRERQFLIPQTISTSFKSAITTPNIDHNKSPYLAIKRIFEGNYYNTFLESNKHRTDWLEYKVEDIDSLKLPVLSEDGVIRFIAPSKSSTSYKAPNIVKSINIDVYKSTVPYLRIKSIFEGNNKLFEEDKQRIDWLNYKIDNVDSLKLPGSPKDEKIQFIAPTINRIKFKSTSVTTARPRTKMTTIKPTTTTMDPALIGIKPPMPRKIESNQFRRKKVLANANIGQSSSAKTETGDLKTNNAVPLTVESSSQTTHTTTKPLINKPNVAENTNTHVTSSPYSSNQIFNYQYIQPTYSKQPSNVFSTVPPATSWYGYSKTPSFQETYKNASPKSANVTLKPVLEQTTAKPADNIYKFPSQSYNSSSKSANVFNSFSFKTPTTSTSKEIEAIKITTQAPVNFYQKPRFNFSIQNNSRFNYITTKDVITTKSPLNAFITTNTSNYNPLLYRFSNIYQNNLPIKPQTNNFSQYSSNNTNLVNSTNTIIATSKSKDSSDIPVSSQITNSWSRFTTSKPQIISTSWKFSPFTYKPILTTPPPVVVTTLAQANKSLTSYPPTSQPQIASISWKYSPFSITPISFTPPPVVTNVAQANKSSTSNSSAIQAQMASISSKYSSFTYKPISITPPRAVVPNVAQVNKSLIRNPSTGRPQTASTSWKYTPFTYKTTLTTPSPVVTYVNKSSTWTQNSTTTSSTKAPETSTKSTPSIFDLYLRPQKFTLPPFQFSSFNTSFHKNSIFSGGTTASPSSNRASVPKT